MTAENLNLKSFYFRVVVPSPSEVSKGNFAQRKDMMRQKKKNAWNTLSFLHFGMMSTVLQFIRYNIKHYKSAYHFSNLVCTQPQPMFND